MWPNLGTTAAPLRSDLLNSSPSMWLDNTELLRGGRLIDSYSQEVRSMVSLPPLFTSYVLLPSSTRFFP